MDACLTKPFTVRGLANCLDTWLPGHFDGDQVASVAVAEEEASDAVVDVDRCPEWPGSDAPPSPSAPLIDRSVLDEITGYSGPSSAIFQRIVNLFLEHAPNAFDAIRSAMTDSSNDDLAKAAHALKSMSANVGAAQLAAICGRMEEYGHAGDRTAIKLMQAEAFWLFNETKKEIAKLIATDAGASELTVHESQIPGCKGQTVR
jgi:two-component system sensor histidine kinase BarA